MPLFALANAGIVINAGFLSRAYASPITLGILLGLIGLIIIACIPSKKLA